MVAGKAECGKKWPWLQHEIQTDSTNCHIKKALLPLCAFCFVISRHVPIVILSEVVFVLLYLQTVVNSF